MGGLIGYQAGRFKMPITITEHELIRKGYGELTDSGYVSVMWNNPSTRADAEKMLAKTNARAFADDKPQSELVEVFYRRVK
jgi:hypothetical protein